MKCGCRHVKERDAPPLEQIDKERENPPPLVGAGVPDRPAGESTIITMPGRIRTRYVPSVGDSLPDCPAGGGYGYNQAWANTNPVPGRSGTPAPTE